MPSGMNWLRLLRALNALRDMLDLNELSSICSTDDLDTSNDSKLENAWVISENVNSTELSKLRWWTSPSQFVRRFSTVIVSDLMLAKV